MEEGETTYQTCRRCLGHRLVRSEYNHEQGEPLQVDCYDCRGSGLERAPQEEVASD